MFFFLANQEYLKIIEITRVKRGQFLNVQKSREWFIPKTARTKHVITGQSDQTSKYFLLKLISFNSGQLQNNTDNGAMPFTSDHVIRL